MRFGYRLSIVLLAVALTACSAPASSPTAPPMTELPTLEATVPTAETDTPAAPPTSSPVSGWREYRDARYGYGVSLPCYWRVTPTPMEGIFAAMTAHSYSEEFFAQHSERGEWKNGIWPPGAYKLDAVVLEGLDPSLSLPDALRAWYSDPQHVSEQELVSVEETTFGLQTAYVATVQGGLQGATPVRIVYFPLGDGKVVGFVFLPDSALDSQEVEGILSSFATTSDEPVSPPPSAPSGPPDGGPIACG